ncbi:uncharacterized protein LOC106645339 [Copidosoma floridanum]|uniref:uncharacterized protein LOC106645339 n=1 Tax=Copidosoma floridanum TaxID=29053 RepID=UPI0006C97ADB|nr:uncharacterized protein LOC106645339 [Copidosoma floridanum]
MKVNFLRVLGKGLIREGGEGHGNAVGEEYQEKAIFIYLLQVLVKLGGLVKKYGTTQKDIRIGVEEALFAAQGLQKKLANVAAWGCPPPGNAGKPHQRARPDAILIKPAEGKKYAEVLAQMKKVSLDELGVGAASVRETRTGGVLVKLRKANAERHDAFAAALKSAVVDAGGVRTLVPRLVWEIRNVYPTVTEEEVTVAMKGRFDGAALPEMVLRLSSGTTRGNRVTYIEAPASAAAVLDKMDHLQLGWVNCRIWPRTKAKRCYRCLGFGHISHQCGGSDRTGACFRCGKIGHVAWSCLQKEASCYLCENVNPRPDTSHVAGSARTVLEHDLLDQFSRARGVDLLFINEPSRTLPGRGWYCDRTRGAAILIRSEKFSVSDTGSGDGFLWIRERLAELEDTVQVCRESGDVVLAGDFNSKAIVWGESRTNPRGRAVLEMAARLDLIVMNSGGSETFKRPGNRGTIIDLTLVSSEMVARVSDWQVLEDYTASYHQYVSFVIHEDRGANSRHVNQRRVNEWNVAKLNRDLLLEAMVGAPPLADLNKIKNQAEAEALVSGTTRRVEEWCDRHRTREGARAAAAAYKVAKKALVRAIKVSKNRCWRELITEVNKDMWGLGYQIALKRLRG